MDDLFEKLENEEGTKGWGARILKYEGKGLWTPPSVLSITPWECGFLTVSRHKDMQFQLLEQ